MSKQIACPNCGVSATVSEKRAGRRIRCTRCSSVFVAATSSDTQAYERSRDQPSRASTRTATKVIVATFASVLLLTICAAITYRLVQRSKQVFPGSHDSQSLERGIQIGEVLVSGEAFREKDFVGFFLKLQTESRKSKYEFTRWSSDSREVRLDDDLGNSYKPLTLPKPMRIWRIDTETIRAENVVEDRLLFEEPVADAKWLRISLPSAAFQGKGLIEIRFSVADLKSISGLTLARQGSNHLKQIALAMHNHNCPASVGTGLFSVRG